MFHLCYRGRVVVWRGGRRGGRYMYLGRGAREKEEQEVSGGVGEEEEEGSRVERWERRSLWVLYGWESKWVGARKRRIVGRGIGEKIVLRKIMKLLLQKGIFDITVGISHIKKTSLMPIFSLHKIETVHIMGGGTGPADLVTAEPMLLYGA